MQPPVSEICVLCGLRQATTRDHVPPRGFFKGLEAQFITVPACSQCNNGASSDDEDMRFFVSMQVGKQALGAAQLWDSAALKSVKRKHSLRRQVVDTAREVAVTDPQGQRVVRLAVEVPARLYNTVFGRTTRGLYFHHTGRLLPPQVRVQVWPLTSTPDLEVLQPLIQQEVAGGALSYWYGVAAEEPHSSLWLYRFYAQHWIQACTGGACDA